MAAANYCLCDKCKAKTFYDSDVDYEDSNLGAMAALCKDCAQTHEITIAKRGEVAELRAAAEDVLQAIGRQQRDPAYHSAYLLLQRAARRLRSALAATEAKP